MTLDLANILGHDHGGLEATYFEIKLSPLEATIILDPGDVISIQVSKIKIASARTLKGGPRRLLSNELENLF